MDHGNRRDSNIAAEEILVLGAISLVSARMARRLAALAKQRQPEEGGKHYEQDERYTNEAAVTQAVKEAGFDPFEHKLLGITAMQKMLGKARFDELLTAYIEKPQGKPTLVPESDKRPAMNTAKNDFMEDFDNE